MADVSLDVLNERCAKARNEFLRVADRLRQIQARTGTKGQSYVERLCAHAAKLVKHCEFDFVFAEWPKRSLDPIDQLLSNDESWYEAWESIFFDMQRRFPRRFPPNFGLYNWKNLGSPDVPVLSPNPRAEDWQQRAADFADVCELFSELVDLDSCFAKLRQDKYGEKRPSPPYGYFLKNLAMKSALRRGESTDIAPKPIARSDRVTLFGPHDQPLIRDKKMPRLTMAEYDMVLVLMRAFPNGLSKDEFIGNRGGRLNTWKQLRGKHSLWAEVLQSRGTDGKPGYRIL